MKQLACDLAVIFQYVSYNMLHELDNGNKQLPPHLVHVVHIKGRNARPAPHFLSLWVPAHMTSGNARKYEISKCLLQRIRLKDREP